uniref:NADH-ubiquinone oxidoreductase chain 6 n=1 Tax=Petrobiellus sp. 2 JZ-2014 TaxID=1529459 RepID=A0A0B4N5N7_9INSE|nr:NADH dehydrogenase subunit 6 [Petrobiellus sp. 2 JZ-2014]
MLCMLINLILITISLTLNLTMIVSNHPLTMGLILMTQTTLIAILIGTLNQTFWFSYVLFLIFIGGLLVLFIYVASLAANEMFMFSSKSFISMNMSLLMTIILMLNMDTSLMTTKMLNSETTMMMSNNIEKIITSISKFYTSEMMPITVMIILYLFLTLIVIVKITQLTKGPLRTTKI